MTFMQSERNSVKYAVRLGEKRVTNVRRVQGCNHIWAKHTLIMQQQHKQGESA